MKRALTLRRVSILFGAIKWLPVVAMPFAAFFFETWLQVCIYKNDYTAAEVRTRMRDISSHIGRLQEREDELKALKRAAEKAPDLGLVPIQPGQVEVLYAPEQAPEPVYDEYVKPITIADANPAARVIAAAKDWLNAAR